MGVRRNSSRVLPRGSVQVVVFKQFPEIARIPQIVFLINNGRRGRGTHLATRRNGYLSGFNVLLPYNISESLNVPPAQLSGTMLSVAKSDHNAPVRFRV